MKKLLLLFSMVTCWLTVSSQTYCTTSLYVNGCTFADDIDDFSLGTFFQVGTGCSPGGYADYTSTPITITQSSNYVSLTATTNYSGSEWFGVWVDWNDDGDFDDAGEFMTYSQTSHGSSNPYVDSILVDNTKPVGLHRLRIRVKFGGSALQASESCLNFAYGETHDYTIDVKPNIIGGCANGFSNFVVDSILAVSARVNWTPGTGNTSWYIEYGLAGFTPGSAGSTKLTGVYPTNQPPVHITGLAPSTSYEIYFGEICNSGADTAYLANALPFTTTVSCPMPTSLAASPLTSYTGTASWTSLLSTSYEVIYDTSGFDPALYGTSILTSNTSTNFSSLSPNTSYDVYVIGNCGAGGLSDTAGPVSFRTPCIIATAPFSENFDGPEWIAGVSGSNSNSVISPCWTRSPNLANTTSPATFQMGPYGAPPSSGTGPSSDLTGGNFIYGEASWGATGQTASLISPPIDVSGLTTPGLYFFQHRFANGSSIADMYVEISNDLGASWDTVYYVTGQTQTSIADPWKLEFVNLAAYTGDTIQVKFRQKYNGCCADAAIDSVVVDEAPTCPWPTAITVNATTDSSATISWTDPTGSSWQILWGPPGFTQASPGSGTKLTSYNPDTIQGLQPNTTYEFYVQTVCGGSNGNSIIIGPGTFRTECAPLFAPYSRNFDSDVSNTPAQCWKAYKTGASITFSQAYVQTTTNAFSPGNALYLYNYTPNTVGDTTMAVSPNFGDMTDGDKQVKFKAKSTSTSGSPRIYVGTVSGNRPGSTFTPMDTIPLTTSYQEFTVKITVADGYNSTDHYFGIMHGKGTTFQTLYVDDFLYEDIPSCNPPASLSLGAATTTATSELLFWGNGAGDSTIIEVGPSGFTPGTSTYNFVGGTTDTFIMSTGLSAQTTYCYYLKDTCFGVGSSPWVGPYCFTTPCVAQSMPYYESFDVFKPACWDSVGGQWFWTPYQGPGTDVYAEAKFWNHSTGQAVLTSPPVSITQDAQVRFKWSHLFNAFYSDDELMIRATVAGSGVWDTILSLKGSANFNDPTANSTSPGAFISEEIILDPAVYTGNDVIVELRGITDFGPNVYVNDFYIENAPACPKLINLAANGVTDSSVTMDWNPSSAASAYQVWFGPQGFYQGTATIGGTKIITTSDSLYTDTLTDNRCYEFLVRSICSPGDSSEWEGPVSFCTPCLPTNAPYWETYDMWPLSCWDMTGGDWDWVVFTGSGGDNYAEADFWGKSSGVAWMTSPVINLNANKAVVEFEWSHLYSSSYPDDQLLVAVNKLGTNVWDTIVDFQGPTNFNDPTAGNSGSPGQFITETVALDSMTYANSSIRVRFIGVTDYGPDLFINNFKVRYPVTDDLELIGARFSKKKKCLSNADTAFFEVQNILGSTVNFTTDPLTVHYVVTGPVNTTSSVTVNSGTLPLMDTIEVMANNIDLSLPGVYTLNAWIDLNSTNLDGLNDTLLTPKTITIYDDWVVTPDTVVVINNTTDTVILEAKSPYLEGETFLITEICHFRGSSTGAPSGGWPAYLVADDYIEITGVPGSDLGGFSLEEWSATAMLTSHTFPAGTVMGPNGTAIIAVGSYGSSVPSPSNFYYHGPNGSYSSGSAVGRVLKNTGGTIIDAVTYGPSYTFPAAAAVTAADWTGTSLNGSGTAGIRLQGPDMNGPTGWLIASSTNPQNPNSVNPSVPLPAGSATAGFGWTLNGNLVDSLPKTVVGPYTSSGVFNYIATFNGPCGLQSDTVTVIVNLPGSCPAPTGLTGTAPACDSVIINWANGNDSVLVAYAPTGSTAGTGTLVTGGASSYAATGLTPSTNYSFYVANICGNDTSAYAGPYNINSGTAGAPVASFTGNAQSFFGLVYDFDASASTGNGNTYIWDFGDGNSDTGKVVSNAYAAGGPYTVKLIVINACGSDTISILFSDISLGENVLSQHLKLYPNPAHDVLNVELNLAGNSDVSVKVMDMSGKQVQSFSQSKTEKVMKMSVDISKLSKGVYMIEVSDGYYSTTRRLVKE